MATLKGLWRWREAPVFETASSWQIAFCSCGEEFTGIRAEETCVYYVRADGSELCASDGTGFASEEACLMDFGSAPVTVTEDLYTVLTSFASALSSAFARVVKEEALSGRTFYVGYGVIPK